jgi:hypothetical protein
MWTASPRRPDRRPVRPRPASARLGAGLAGLVLSAACGGGAAPGSDTATDPAPLGGDSPDADPAAVCPDFAPLAVMGEVASTAAQEISGLAASVDHPGLLWAHNDDAGPATLLGLTASGGLAATATLDATVTDLEDLGRVDGPADGPDLLYLADTGDNDLVRDGVRVLRIAEPAVDPGATGPRPAVADVAVFDLRYGDGQRHDAEALIVEPDSGDLYLFTKHQERDPRSLVFRVAGLAGLAAGAYVLEPVLDDGDAPGLDGRIVTASLSPDGALVLVGFSNEDTFRIWPRAGSIGDTLRGAPCQAPRAEGQVEGAAFLPDSSGYYMTAEGASPPIVLARFER